MDFTEIVKGMETMTDAQIASIQKSAEGILKIRENNRKVEAIQNFKKAFDALQNTGVCIAVEYETDYVCGDMPINSIDQFYFS